MDKIMLLSILIGVIFSVGIGFMIYKDNLFLFNGYLFGALFTGIVMTLFTMKGDNKK